MKMNNKVQLSIIVPVYNTCEYLEKCLDSLLNQNIENMELILVDDGSSDGSEEICRDYAERYCFIHLIRQNNKGVCAALKAGMNIVSGEYVSFCGSDDFVEKDFYSNLYHAAKREDADIVQCGFSLYYNDELIERYQESRLEKAVKDADGDSSKIMDVMLNSPSITVRRVHRTALLRQYNIDFDTDINIAEDLLFSSQTLLVAKKIVCIEQYGYFYRQNREGRQTKIGNKKLLDFFLIFDKLDDFIKKNNICQFHGVTLLRFNITVDALSRINKNFYPVYADRFIENLRAKDIFTYINEGIRYSIKLNFRNYFIVVFLCFGILMSVWGCAKTGYHAYWMLNLLLIIKQGNLLARMKNTILRGKKRVFLP